MSQKNTLLNKRLFSSVIGLGVLGLDQLSKSGIRQHLSQGESWIINNSLYLSHVENKGALLGLFSGHTFVLGLISLSIALFLFGLIWRLKGQWPAFMILGLLLGGVSGNLWDRLYWGSVLDFIDLRWQGQNIWPVFNLADLAIDLALLVFLIWRLSVRWQADA